MFHVSTMIPYTEDDPQQLARKRHLGNDVIVIIFQEEGMFFSSRADFLGVDWVFDPSIIHSYFNHVFIVIRKDHEESKARGTTMYRLAVTFKSGVQDFGPAIPSSSLIEKSNAGREFLLTKCMLLLRNWLTFSDQFRESILWSSGLRQGHQNNQRITSSWHFQGLPT